MELATGSLVRVNPLALWTWEEVWAYLGDFVVPTNPLYAEGYQSIGDVMTTAKSSGGERDGRFQGQNSSECGMHSLEQRAQDTRQQAQAQGWEAEARARRKPQKF